LETKLNAAIGTTLDEKATRLARTVPNPRSDRAKELIPLPPNEVISRRKRLLKLLGQLTWKIAVRLFIDKLSPYLPPVVAETFVQLLGTFSPSFVEEASEPDIIVRAGDFVESGQAVSLKIEVGPITDKDEPPPSSP
jgi:hypothetical protein